ncbi:MAG: TMEM175 family protein [Actinomycetota bacterium]|nr:TMEM175 family protein [Actinomycetota bacterium]MDQ2956463.1 TMEM175 family protein [Actinomycetota bacterium]
MSTSRLEAFSDGVFAIVITLLVLDLHGPTEHQSIASALAHEKYTITAYVVAFLIVGVLWINHHSVFRNVQRLDRALTFANLMLLLFITATPFTAALFADGLQRGGFDAKVGAAVFSAMFTGVALLYSVLWILVSRDGILAEHLDAAAARSALHRFGLGVVPYAILIALSFLSPLAVLVIHGLLAVYYAFDQLDPATFTKD